MKSFILFLFSCSAIVLNAQDVIYKKDKSRIDAKVVEVGTWEIKYKLSSNPDGPVYVLPKSDIATVVFQNGTFEVFTSKDRPARSKKFDSLSVNFARNCIGIDLGEFTSTSIGMVYEHTFGKGMVAMRLPFSIGIDPYSRYNYYNQRKIFTVGLDLQYFPTGQGKFKYFVAPYFEWGMFNYANYYVLYDSYGYYQPNYSYYTAQRFSGGVKNGILVQPTKHFSISADLGFGIQGNTASYPNSRISPQARANFIIGYRF